MARDFFVGPNNAFKLIVEHKSIEGVLDHIDKTKFAVPESWAAGDYKTVEFEKLWMNLARALTG